MYRLARSRVRNGFPFFRRLSGCEGRKEKERLERGYERVLALSISVTRNGRRACAMVEYGWAWNTL